MEDAKQWWKSKTILGALAVLVALGIRTAAPASEVGEDEVLGALVSIGEVVGAVLAIYGRLDAKKRIGSPE